MIPFPMIAFRVKSLRTGLRAFCCGVTGTSAVEFALIAAPFLALLVALIETALVFFANQELEAVTVKSSRIILTGQAQDANMTQSQFAQTVCANMAVLFNCNGLMINVQSYGNFSDATATPPTLTFNSQGQVTNTWQYQPGTPGQIVVIQVMYQWPVFLGPLGFTLANLSNGNRLLVATAAFKVEPYQ